jgi:ATPase, P-type (transporting), HAD superfamily, subfamily IC/heavy metal translocating P-type ATPase
MPVETEGFARALLEGHERVKRLLFPLVGALLIAGAIARLTDQPEIAAWLWMGGTATVLLVLLVDVVLSLRRGEFGLDLIAALAMAGALALNEHLAGIIIALMFTGGQSLEDFAQRRARREMTALLSRMPRSAARYSDSGLQEVPLAELAEGDRILVRRGELVPVDGVVESGVAVLDESALTGEAIPVRRLPGSSVMSGSTNVGDAFDIHATSTAAGSTYAGIVRLVEAAEAAKAPMVRLADRYALLFLVVTLLIAGAAWALSTDPVRGLAVLVIATPCPLILAVPVAIISGVSRCAKKGVLVKGGGALEQLAGVRTVLFDKTGTLTDGRARLLEIKSRDDIDSLELLRLAASLDQSSHHVVAQALVTAARERGLRLDTPSNVREQPGSGVVGTVGTHEVVVGGWQFVKAHAAADAALARDVETWIRRDGTVAVVVAVDGNVAGVLLLADQVRPEAGSVLRQLRAACVKRIVLVTGDRADLAESVAAFLGVDAIVSETKPQDKIAVVEAEKPNGPVLMVGDGVNDAPALAAADVGVAMGARGAAAASEAADAVILVDRLDRLVSAVRIARRSRAIAFQSVWAGIGMSVTGMIAAAFGYLAPVQGALLQEAIDVAVILNALRALGGPIRAKKKSKLSKEDLLALESEHHALAGVIDEIRVAADRIPQLPKADVQQELERLDQAIRERLLPHERRDDQEVYARIRQLAGEPDALAGMSRTHMEIQRQAHNLTALRKAFTEDGPSDEQRREAQRLLYGLEAITRLHFAQEEEIYRSLEAD